MKENRNTLNIEELKTNLNVPFIIRFMFGYCELTDNRFIKVLHEDLSFYTIKDTYYDFREMLNDAKIYTENLELVNNENIATYYESYGNGFYNGYNNYDNKLETKLSIFKSEADKAKQIFETIKDNNGGLLHFSSGWINDKRVKILSKELWLSSGIAMGENYKAWEIVLAKYWLFEGLFLEYPPFIETCKLSLDFFSKDEEYLGIYKRLLEITKQPTAITLESNLKPEQLNKILDLVKDIKLFNEPFLQTDLSNVFNNITGLGIKVNNNSNLAYLFSCLKDKELICNNWQKVLDHNQCFKGNRNAYMKAKSFSKALTQIDILSNEYKKINKALIPL